MRRLCVFFLSVEEYGDAAAAATSDCQIQGNTEGVHPERLRRDKRPEIYPISNRHCRISAHVAVQKYNNNGHDDCIDDYGKEPADRNAQRMQRGLCLFAYEFPCAVGEERGDQSGDRPERNIVNAVHRNDIAQKAAYNERGDCLNVKEREHGERLSGADL